MKKKLQVIKPTQRHKKRYVLLKVFSNIDGYTEKDLYFLFNKSFCYTHGFVLGLVANISLLKVDFSEKTLLFRVNKQQLDNFISSLMFVKEVGVISVVCVESTVKEVDVVKV